MEKKHNSFHFFWLFFCTYGLNMKGAQKGDLLCVMMGHVGRVAAGPDSIHQAWVALGVWQRPCPCLMGFSSHQPPPLPAPKWCTIWRWHPRYTKLCIIQQLLLGEYTKSQRLWRQHWWPWCWPSHSQSVSQSGRQSMQQAIRQPRHLTLLQDAGWAPYPAAGSKCDPHPHHHHNTPSQNSISGPAFICQPNQPWWITNDPDLNQLNSHNWT